MNPSNLRNPMMSGVWTAIITPFTASGGVDFDAFKKILDAQSAAGVHGVVPCGTTGESPTLSLDEKKALIQTTIDHFKDSDVGVMAGTGSNNTQASVELSKWASDAGADAVLIVTPYYNKPTQTGLIAHFTAVADAVDCDVVLYNVPGRTQVSLTTDTIVTLAKHEKITTIKEATADIAFASQIMNQLAANSLSMNILSGDDATTLALLTAGGNGCISVASNIIPEQMVSLYNATQAGEFEKANAVHQKHFPMFRDLFCESNPIPIKWAMAHAGYCGSGLRLPLTELSAENAKILKETLSQCEAPHA